uniref:Uncharacterized protein n=1 Tax=Anguilla anguilla TaxID=7936 RepID=A0A0E9QPM7_ANGAN
MKKYHYNELNPVNTCPTDQKHSSGGRCGSVSDYSS